MQEADKERKDFERLKRLYDSDAAKEAKHKREPIPEDVRIAVWRRDQGKCVQCDSNESLEYDHIIPVSKGGSDTVRNIQLLCETCNRKKSDSIGRTLGKWDGAIADFALARGCIERRTLKLHDSKQHSESGKYDAAGRQYTARRAPCKSAPP